MVRGTIIMVGLVIGLAAVSISMAVADGGLIISTNQPTAQQATISGVITARYGAMVTLKSVDGRLYTVNAQTAVVNLDGMQGNSLSLRVGDRAKVTGPLVDSNSLNATNIQITLTPAEAATTHMSAGAGAGPSTAASDNVEMPSVGDSLGNWRSRGLVVGTKYRDRQLTIVTSTGSFMIDAKTATITRGARTVSIADINEGDVIRVWGDLSGLNRVSAERVEIIQGRHQLEAAVPLRNVAVKGVVTYIDYPSSTFKIDTGTNELRILADENTFIHVGFNRKAFMDLTIGQTLKISGVGNLGNGFVASEIIIVSAPGD